MRLFACKFKTSKRVEQKKEVIYMKKMKRILSAAMALLLMATLPVTAFAQEYNIDEGSISVSSDSTGQYVTQVGGVQNELQTTETVITQTDSSTATSNTITVTTTGDAAAEFTLQEVNIEASGDAIDIGDSSAEITLEGDNELYSKSGSAVHVSGGDLAITGDGSLEADNSYNDNAAIGSHVYEDMSGSVTIGGSAQVTALGGGYGASIGSGYGGEMSGNVTVDGKAEVTAVSDDDGAGIGSGGYGEMSGSVVITDHAQVTAWSDAEGAGIGSGDHGDLSGSIIIGGSAQVIAAGNDESSGIGTGNKGTVTSGARIIIRDNAKVTAIGEDEGCGIGSGEDRNMDGLIIIRDNARVTAIAGDQGAAIGSEEWYDLEGSIIIIGNADVSTGMLLDDDVSFDYDTKEIKYTVDPDAVGVIGDGNPSHHDSNYGNYILGSDVTINGIKGSDTEALREYVNMRLHDGDPENLTMLDYVIRNNEITVTATGEGQILMLLYDGKETPPTEPGTYPVTVVMRISEESEECLEFEICDLVIPEPETAQPAPLYRVTDKNGRNMSYKAEQKNGVLTITVDADFAILTGTLSGISTMKGRGTEKIVFVTKDAKSTFALADLLKKGSIGEPYKLTHDGKTVTFTRGAKNLDMSDILEKE
jgi:hypothetical protein